MTALAEFRRKVARWIAPSSPPSGKIAIGSAMGGFVGMRSYAAAKNSRLTSGWQTSNSSADSELTSSLTSLRSRSRALIRDAAYAKRAKIIVVNNVVGAGLGMQAQVMTTRATLNQTVNDDIEAAWEKWEEARFCHTGGTLHFHDLERAAMGQVFEAGEIIIRKHPRTFGDSPVPYALELIEPERLADEISAPTGAITPAPGNILRMGIEVDPFYRPVAYWLHQRHVGEVFVSGASATDRIERVPAEQIIHLRIVDRWPQTRGEPWLHAVIRKLNDMDGYSESELIAARAGAAYFATIESPDDQPLPTDEKEDGSRELSIEPGTIDQLAPGDKLKFHSPNRPNTALDPFMRYMLRECAAGVGVSYESLSRDYSQSNYSSSRLALLDDRDLWRVLQRWFIRAFRKEVHREWLRQAVFARAIPSVSVEAYAAAPEKFEAALFKPRGWGWIDPTKEVEAYREAVRCGFTTVSAVISATGDGRDLEDVINERRAELDAMAEKDLLFDTDPALAAPTPGTQADTPAEPATTEKSKPQSAAAEPPARVVNFGRRDA